MEQTRPETAPQMDLRFALVLLMPLLTIYGMWLHGPGSIVGTLVIWWGLALIDALWPHADRSPPPVQASAAWSALLTGLVRAYVPLQLLMMGLGAWLVWSHEDLELPGVLTMGFSVGFVCGAQGITLAHELGHRRSRLDRALGWVLMTMVAYGHFMVEHYRGHHVRVATPEDPASARPGESFMPSCPEPCGAAGKARGILRQCICSGCAAVGGAVRWCGAAWWRARC